jgi:NADH-ubiquinone oxidoreductase chain 6
MLYLYITDNISLYVNLTILEFLIVLFTIFIIINRNPIISVLFLIGLFLFIAIYLIIIGLSFIGLSYLLVYIGAVSILFLFILMLIDIRISELHTETNNSIFLSLLIGILYYNIISSNIYYNNIIFNINKIKVYESSNIKHSLYNIWDGSLIENFDIISIGNILYTNLSLWLIISLLVLLLAMIGSIKINIK